MQFAVLTELLIILAAGLTAAIICRKLHVSMLIGYLVAGVLLGEGALGWVENEGHQLEYFAEAGVFLLLFTIGLEFSLDDLRSLGRNMLLGGSLQMLLVALPVGIALWAWGVSPRAAILLSAATAFSSTVLVFKALSEWGHFSYPHGQRAIAILLFQDAALIPLLLLVPLLTEQGEQAGIWQYFSLAAISLLFVMAVVALRFVLSQQLVPRLMAFRTPELILLFVLVSLGGITLGSYLLGLPPAVGAFATGLIFNGNRWSEQIDALVLPFRETFAAIFFVSLGLIFDPTLLATQWLFVLTALVGVVVLKTIASSIALWWTGLAWPASLGMGIGLGHIGEFAFVLILLGLESGLVAEDQYQRIVAVAVGSLILTPLLIKLGLRWTNPTSSFEAEPADKDAVLPLASGLGAQEAIVIGAGPIGKRVAAHLETIGRSVCLVDLSPINLHRFAQAGIRTIAGNATDRGVLKLAGVTTAQVIVVCVPDDVIALRIVQSVRLLNSDCRLIVRCRYQENSKRLIHLHVDRVVSEEALAGLKIIDEITCLKIN